MKRGIQYALSLLVTSVVMVHSQTSTAKEPPRNPNTPFSFALIGDVPYGVGEVQAFQKVVAEINQDEGVQFVMHTGDVKGGAERCDDALIQSRFNGFQAFKTAFIFTPGDNDWTDCHRVNNGSYNPIERLQFLRKLFFPKPTQSTGQRPIPVISQGTLPGSAFSKYVENTLFVRNRIVFSTVHVVGSNNNLSPWLGIDPTDSLSTPRADRLAEFQERQQATLEWLKYTFAKAEAENAAGVFIMIQANPRFDLPSTDPNRLGFNEFLAQLRTLTEKYGKPVVLAQGDDHVLIIDKPFGTPAQGSLRYFTRIQAFGSPQVNWIKVRVNPNASPVFTFEEKIVP